MPSMRHVTDWFEKRGMSDYGQHFADNDIGFSILGDVTYQDLAVASLGHRRKILRATGEFDRPEAMAVPPQTNRHLDAISRRSRTPTINGRAASAPETPSVNEEAHA
jgi:hypothetical protein